MKNIIILSLIATFSSGLAYSQGGWLGVEYRPLFDATVTGTLPHGEFAQYAPNFGFGFNLGFYYPVSRRVPFYLGLSGGYTGLGSHSEDVHQDVIITAGNTVIDVIPVDMEVKTKNTLSYLFFGTRYVAPIRIVKPYVEAKIGFQALATHTDIYDRTWNGWLTTNDDDLISSTKVSGSYVFAYGFELGAMIPLGEAIAIKTGCAYNFGGKSRYFDKDQIEEWDVQFTGSTYNSNDLHGEDFTISDSAEPRESRTNNFLLHLGISFCFN